MIVIGTPALFIIMPKLVETPRAYPVFFYTYFTDSFIEHEQYAPKYKGKYQARLL